VLGRSRPDAGDPAVDQSTTLLAEVRPHQGDWSKDELAYLHHAARLLSANGLCVESECGLTDECDPWFVYCDAESGDVLVHFARVDGSYVACSPFDDGALTGPVLSDVIDEFLQTRIGLRPTVVGIRSTPAA
jgi:hypothetical protein